MKFSTYTCNAILSEGYAENLNKSYVGVFLQYYSQVP